MPPSASAKSAGGTPISTAIACSSVRARAHQRRALGARVGQLGLGLQHVALRGDAGLVAVAGDLQRALVAFDGDAQHADLGVGLAQREVVDRQLAHAPTGAPRPGRPRWPGRWPARRSPTARRRPHRSGSQLAPSATVAACRAGAAAALAAARAARRRSRRSGTAPRAARAPAPGLACSWPPRPRRSGWTLHPVGQRVQPGSPKSFHHWPRSSASAGAAGAQPSATGLPSRRPGVGASGRS